MKITFFSNFLNHHQLPFCKELYEKLGDDFKFIATEPVPEERLKMGYYDMSTKYPFALNTYSNAKAYEDALKLGNDSDVVIIGSAPNKFIKKRLADNKLTFYYAERIFKKGRHRIFNPRTLLYLLTNHTFHKKKNLYMLCASAYTAADFNLVGAYKNKTYKWGYFPEFISYDLSTLIKKKGENAIPKLLWVGRFLDWKHPDDAIKLAIILKNKNYRFSLDIIGTGDMETELKNIINENNLHNEVRLLGSMKPEKVREHMERANIFLFTSDFNEGWGAVLNESMNSGCAVVVSHAVGSAPFLIRNKENGYIYKSGDIDHLYKNVKILLEDTEEQKRIGINAYKTIQNTWNIQEAASRIIQVSSALLHGEEFCFQSGPCSKAEILINNWYKE